MCSHRFGMCLNLHMLRVIMLICRIIYGVSFFLMADVEEYRSFATIGRQAALWIVAVDRKLQLWQYLPLSDTLYSDDILLLTKAVSLIMLTSNSNDFFNDVLYWHKTLCLFFRFALLLTLMMFYIDIKVIETEMLACKVTLCLFIDYTTLF